MFFFCNREIKKINKKGRESQIWGQNTREREACMKGYDGCGLA
jgi:hypothetical protein